MVQANLRQLQRLKKEAREQNEAISSREDQFTKEDTKDTEKKEESAAAVEVNDKTKRLLDEESAPIDSSAVFSVPAVANTSSAKNEQNEAILGGGLARTRGKMPADG